MLRIDFHSLAVSTDQSANSGKSSTSPSAVGTAAVIASHGNGAGSANVTAAVVEGKASNNSTANPTITVNHLAVIASEENEEGGDDRKMDRRKRISFLMDNSGGGTSNATDTDKEANRGGGGSSSGPCSPCSICDASSGFSATASGDDDDLDDEDGEDDGDDDVIKVEIGGAGGRCNGGLPSRPSFSKDDMDAVRKKMTPSVFWRKSKRGGGGQLSSKLPRSASSSSAKLMDMDSLNESPRHLVTYVTSSLETIPLEINQDIPELML